jgi:hypothetical protein
MAQGGFEQMDVAGLARQFGYSLAGVLMMMSMSPSRALAQEQHAHAAAASNAATLVDVVRQSTERFKDVNVAQAEGYALAFGSVSGAEYGAMGMHFVNFPFVLDGELDPTKPDIVIYEPMPNGRLKLIGADYLVLASAWDANHPGTPPQIMGQLLHRFESPNRFGLPDFYTLHVLAWKENPTGMFVNWHSNVKCDAFSGQ